METSSDSGNLIRQRKFGATLRIGGEKSSPLLPQKQPSCCKECICGKKHTESHGESFWSQHVHTDTNGLRSCKHADGITEHESGIGGCQLTPRQLGAEMREADRIEASHYTAP